MYVEIKCKSYAHAVRLQGVLRKTTEGLSIALISPSHDDFRVAITQVGE